jgi:hypothetical protein
MSKPMPYPDVSETIYELDETFEFICPGVGCKFKACEIMPPDEESECFHKDYGHCNSPKAKRTAVKALIYRANDLLYRWDVEEAAQ